MIPLRDVIPPRTTPMMVYALMTATSLVFLSECLLPPAHLAAVIHAVGPAAGTMPSMSIVAVTFLHADWLHLIANLWMLWIFGENVEDRFGHGRLLACYLITGVGATLLSHWLAPASLTAVGASGAIAGLIGAYLVLFPTSRIQILVWLILSLDIVEVPAMFLAGFWFLLQLITGVSTLAGATDAGSITVWALLGSFVTGAALAKLLDRPERREVAWWSGPRADRTSARKLQVRSQNLEVKSPQ
jgi:membrane associated rhomboid family serine protease